MTAAVVHTENDHYFTSVSVDTDNASAVLCVETGAIFVKLSDLQSYH